MALPTLLTPHPSVSILRNPIDGWRSSDVETLVKNRALVKCTTFASNARLGVFVSTTAYLAPSLSQQHLDK